MNIEKTVDEISPLAQDFGGEVDEIRTEVANFRTAEEKIREKNRNLSISIVGRVKSGKSSFLNALVFKGESILPQAATPMTAALTYIRYAPKCRAEVEFFTQDEWETFKVQSAKYDEILSRARADLVEEEELAKKKAKMSYRTYKPRTITDEIVSQRAMGYDEMNENYSAAHELIAMAGSGRIDLSKYLGTTFKTDEYDSTAELVGVLGDYVGSQGRFTPIVCSTTIYLNDKKLDGYEIVDTPGTNDPVISRGMKTVKSLASTDVVLAVSPAGRFFDNGDLALFGQNLPASGIKDFMIIASQYDLAVGNIENKVDRTLPPRKRLIQAMATVQRQLKDSYRERIGEIARQARVKGARDVEKWERLLKAEPQCVSAQAYILSRHWNSLTQKETEQLEVFNTRIPGFSFDRKMLLDFSMLDQVEEKIASVKAKKAEITERRSREFEDTFAVKFREMIASLKRRVEQRVDTLTSKDVAQLANELKAQTAVLEKGRAGLENVFLASIEDVRGKFADLLSGVREAKSEYARLDVQVETHTEVEDHGCGFLWWRCWTGNRYEKYTVTTRYADTYQVVEQVDAFANKAKDALERGIRGIVDIRQIQNKIVDATLDLFEEGSNGDLDIASLKIQIENAVRKIRIPEADFGDVDYTKTITDRFAGERVEDGEIHALKAAQREALYAVVGDLERLAKSKTAEIEDGLTDAMNTFVDKLVADLRSENERLVKSLADREATLARVSGYLKVFKSIA